MCVYKIFFCLNTWSYFPYFLSKILMLSFNIYHWFTWNWFLCMVWGSGPSLIFSAWILSHPSTVCLKGDLSLLFFVVIQVSMYVWAWLWALHSILLTKVLKSGRASLPTSLFFHLRLGYPWTSAFPYTFYSHLLSSTSRAFDWHCTEVID